MNDVISELLVVMVLGEMALGKKALGETALGETALGEIAVRHNCRPPVQDILIYLYIAEH